MKRKAVPIAFFLLLFASVVYSQPWHYNLGDSVRSFSTASTVSVSFMPNAPSGTARIRVGSTGGSFNLQKSSPPEFGLNSYLRIAAPTTASVNKFSIYDYTPGKSLTLKFKLRLGGVGGSSLSTANGTWLFFAGNGNCFADNNGFANADCFLGIQFVFGNSGVITMNTRSGSGWVQIGTPGSIIQQGMNYDVEIYANNSSAAQNYTYTTGPQSVAANKWDIYINGVLVGNDLGKAALPGNTNIDSWMFYGESSSGNLANIFLDEFDFTNTIADSPLPVTLGSFSIDAAGRNVILSWQTLNELNNAGFEIERCKVVNDMQDKWSKVGFVKGHVTTNEPRSYSYSDKDLNAGLYKYRLKQVDVNGNYEYFLPQNTTTAEIQKPSKFELLQNYPNPSNPSSKIDFKMPFDGNISLKVYDISGKEVAILIDGYRTSDFYSVKFDGSDLPSGIYFYRLITENGKESFTKTLKMILLK